MMYKPDSVYRAGITLDMIAGVCQMINDTRARLGPSSSPSTEYKMPVYGMFLRAFFIIEEIDTWEEEVPEHWKRQFDPENALDLGINTEAEAEAEAEAPAPAPATAPPAIAPTPAPQISSTTMIQLPPATVVDRLSPA